MDIDFNSLLDAISRFGLKLIGVALLLLGAWIVARWVRRGVTKSLQKTRLDEAGIGIPFPQMGVHLDK